MRERDNAASPVRREQDFSALFRTGAAFKDVPTDELQRQVLKAVAEVRAENRRQESHYASGGPA